MLIHCSQHTAPMMNVYFYIYDSWQILEGWLKIYSPEEHYEPKPEALDLWFATEVYHHQKVCN